MGFSQIRTLTSSKYKISGTARTSYSGNIEGFDAQISFNINYVGVRSQVLPCLFLPFDTQNESLIGNLSVLGRIKDLNNYRNRPFTEDDFQDYFDRMIGTCNDNLYFVPFGAIEKGEYIDTIVSRVLAEITKEKLPDLRKKLIEKEPKDLSNNEIMGIRKNLPSSWHNIFHDGTQIRKVSLPPFQIKC